MKIFFGFLLLLSSSVVHAQSSPAFDPDVYLPTIGNGIDTVQGHDTTGFFGAGIINLGPGPGSDGFGRIAMQGIPGNEANLTTIKTGHDFDLHQLEVMRQLNLSDLHGDKHWGHFRSKAFTDLLISDNVNSNNVQIYWSDSLGNFDVKRRTGLVAPKNDVRFKFYENMSGAYSTYLSSDSCEDVLWTFVGWDSTGKPIAFAAFYQGGAKLFNQGSEAGPDSMIYLGNDVNPLFRNFSQADWRGVGRDDLIAVESDNHTKHNWHYFRNSPPFSFGAFARSLVEDTIFLARENPEYVGQAFFGENIFSMRALPKHAGDSSMDFMPMMGKLYIFRGGPDFGTHHLFMDSAEVAITNPSDIDPQMHGLDGWGTGVRNCGDMTGSGNPVILTGGNILTDALYFFFVLGRAAKTDELTDMYIFDGGGGSADSITGDADNLEDQFWGNTYESKLMLIHGSKRVPVHLNSRYSVDLEASLTEGSLIAYPNPARTRTTLTLKSSATERVEVIVRDLLGRERVREEHQLSQGLQQFPVLLKKLNSGSYVIQVVGAHTSLHCSIAVLR